MAAAEAGEVHVTAEDVARRSYGKLVAFLAARSRDVAAAEDALADAFAAALADWPGRGIPANPEAWLMSAARRRLTDAARRRRVSEGAAAHLQLLSDELATAAQGAIPDDRLSLMFAPPIRPSTRPPARRLFCRRCSASTPRRSPRPS